MTAPSYSQSGVMRMVAKAIALERERCARICERLTYKGERAVLTIKAANQALRTAAARIRE